MQRVLQFLDDLELRFVLADDPVLGLHPMPIDDVEGRAPVNQEGKPVHTGLAGLMGRHHLGSRARLWKASRPGSARTCNKRLTQYGRERFSATHPKRYQSRTVTAITVLLALGCGGDPVTPPVQKDPISVTFTNRLRYPVTITAPGMSGALVSSTSTVVFPGGTTSVTWTEPDDVYGDGSPVPDDLGPQTILVADKATLIISNIVGTSTYFEPYLTNKTGVTVGVAIVQSGTVRCIGAQSPGTSGARWGYFLLTPQTEWRIYKAGTNCTGTYRYWDYQAISGGMFGNGTVLLEPTTPP